MNCAAAFTATLTPAHYHQISSALADSHSCQHMPATAEAVESSATASRTQLAALPAVLLSSSTPLVRWPQLQKLPTSCG